MQPNTTLPTTTIKKFIALLNAGESPGSIPQVTILLNTLGKDITWTYDSIQKTWVGTATGTFPENKTNIIPFGQNGGAILGIGYSLPFDYGYRISRLSNNAIQLEVLKTSDYSNVDPYDVLAINSNIMLSIETYK